MATAAITTFIVQPGASKVGRMIDVNAFAGPVLAATGHGDVLVRRAPPEPNILNLRSR